MRPTNHSTTTLVLLSVLWLLGGWLVGIQTIAQAASAARSTESTSLTADSLLLDQYPNAYAAYSLRKLRSNYSGPAIRVRRGSDGAEQDFGFTGEGDLDIGAIESWLSGADGVVVQWYSQIDGHPSLTPIGNDTPEIASGGTVHTDENGNPKIYFQGTSETGFESGQLPTAIPKQDFTVMLVVEPLSEGDNKLFALVKELSDRVYFETHQVWGQEGSGSGDFNILGLGIPKNDRNVATLSAGGSGQVTRVYMNSGRAQGTSDYLKDTTVSTVEVGYHRGEGYDGYMSEVVVYPFFPNDADYWPKYENINAYWKAGPQAFNKGAIIPQQFDYQVTLYDWLETITVEDVTLPSDGAMTWDQTYTDIDHLADLDQRLDKASASRVVRGEPEWYVLDAGNGKGIEATGDVRIWHSSGGHNERSWANEPAYLYQLDVPMSDGSNGNPFYRKDALAYRALVLAAVDMMMYDDAARGGGFASWNDMHGKAMLGWAEAYRWCKDVLPNEVQEAFETGFGRFLDRAIEQGARNANTNMDMFHLQAMAEVYMATDKPTLKEKAVKAAKRLLFGYTDGALETNHVVGPRADGKMGGVFFPAGYVGENDTPEIFYNGESRYHIMGAYAAVMDRTDGSIPSDWQFIKDVAERAAEWAAYMSFVDVDGHRTGPSGFAGRTSAGEPRTQASESYRDFMMARETNAGTFGLWHPGFDGKNNYIEKNESSLVNDINYKINNKLDNLNDTVTGPPPTWNGWSPWVKETTYLPREGWFTDLQSIKDNPEAAVPFNRSGNTFNKTLGGAPTGPEFWAYKGNDGTQDFGFVVEAQKEQGGYAGWTGGRLEMFWSREGGITIVNRHEKSGAGSISWPDLNVYPLQHVWGENAEGRFTSAFGKGALGGDGPERTTTWNTDGSPPSVSVVNELHSDGTFVETATVIGGQVSIENTFEALSDGVRTTHTVTSNESDEVTELWASIPVYLKNTWGDGQGSLSKTTIEYWDGASWAAMPDPDSGTPSTVNTDALRLGRDFADGEGARYTYVSFSQLQTMRLSVSEYEDDYQTGTLARTVHIDLHGDPGTTKTLPASKSVSYTIQTTDPTSGAGTSINQEIPLKEGWNIASTSVSPAVPDMDSVFSGLQSEITVVENEAGERYRPGENVDEIGQWSSEEAYRIFAKSDVTLTIQGDSLGSPSITLDEGWNLVPYFPSTVLSVEEALSSIVEDLSLVKDELGRAYLPEKDPDALTQMEPGEGYKIYVQQSTTLTYPDNSN